MMETFCGLCSSRIAPLDQEKSRCSHCNKKIVRGAMTFFEAYTTRWGHSYHKYHLKCAKGLARNLIQQIKKLELDAIVEVL